MAEVQNGTGAEKAPAVAFMAVKPWLVVDAPKASDAVQFYKTAFGAEELSRVMHPKRKANQETPLVLSAELKLGSAIVVVSDLIDEDSSPYVFSPSFILFINFLCMNLEVFPVFHRFYGRSTVLMI